MWDFFQFLACGPQFSRFENYVINALAHIEHKLTAQNQLLEKLSISANVGPKKDYTSEFNFNFPLTTLEALNEFEESLKNSKKFNALVSRQYFTNLLFYWM